MDDFSNINFSFKDFFKSLSTTKAIIIICVIGFFVFGNGLFNGFVADDDGQILNNLAVHSTSNIPQFFFGGTFYSGDIQQSTGTYYRPIASTIYSLIYSIFGAHPLFFHLFQIILHIVNAVLVFVILRFFIKNNIAFLLSLFFLVHPIQAEAVDYIADLQDVLFFFFGALALYIFLKWKMSLRLLSFISLLLLLSLFSKETGIVFIGILLTYQLIFKAKKYHLSNFFFILLPIFIYFFIKIVLTHGLGISNTFSVIEQSPIMIRIMTIPLELFYYIKTLIFPFQLALNQMWVFETKDIWFYIFVCTIDLIFLAASIQLGRILFTKNKEMFRNYIFFSIWLGFGLFLHFHIIVPLDATVADRWFYFPFVGLLGMIGIAVQTYTPQKNSKKMFVTLAILLIAFMGIITMIRNTQFHDNYTLLSHDIKYSGNNSYMHSALAVELLQQKRYDEAFNHLQTSIKLNPKGDINWNVLGHYYQKTRQIDKAKFAYKTSIKNAPYYLSYEDLALLLLTSDSAETTAAFTKDALQKFPRNGTLWFFYALAENRLGNKDNALNAAKHAALYFPNAQTYEFYNLLEQNKPADFTSKTTADGITLYVCSESTCN